MLRSPRSPARHHDCSCRQRLASCTLMPSRKAGPAAHRVALACLTPVIDADRAQTQRVGKAARGVLTTDAMNHLESFRSCISCCRLPAFAPIHSPCPEWSSATCPCNERTIAHVQQRLASCREYRLQLYHSPFASTSHATYSLSLSPNKIIFLQLG